MNADQIKRDRIPRFLGGPAWSHTDLVTLLSVLRVFQTPAAAPSGTTRNKFAPELSGLLPPAAANLRVGA
jgi:hypothetical protein